VVPEFPAAAAPCNACETGWTDVASPDPNPERATDWLWFAGQVNACGFVVGAGEAVGGTVGPGTGVVPPPPPPPQATSERAAATVIAAAALTILITWVFRSWVPR
jgi:hypothetical protein